MRLIDADNASLFLNVKACKQIQQMPTVDAIPLEWIEQYKQSIGSQTLVGYRWIEEMQIAWAERREDETN